MSSTSRSEVFANRYLDSVALLRLSGDLEAIDGVLVATAVMATPANLARARDNGIAIPTEAQPNDVFVGVYGDADACVTALTLARERITPPRTADRVAAGEPDAPVSLWQHARRGGAADLALISVPGPYAAAEAAKALDLGLHVMLFSDNLSVEDEVSLKCQGAERGLLVMGPDCGTAMLNGVPLGFANVVRRGPVAVIGASGTGMQEVMSRVHNLGSGISQAIGCGGRDISERIGGATMRQALGMIGSDDATEVVVLVSKPPHPSVLPGILDAARVVTSKGKHVVAVFVGLGDAGLATDSSYVHIAVTLADAADRAVALLGTTGSSTTGSSTERSAHEQVAVPTRGGRVRGGFVGGTFCHEAGVLLAAQGLQERSDLIDFGDDEYTAGRPHPMIEPSVRDRWIGDALADPEIAVVLFDVVLGLGAHFDPLITMRVQLAAPTRRPDVVVVAHVCGTDLDPQNRSAVSAELAASGVHVAGSNAQAVEWVARAYGAAS